MSEGRKIALLVCASMIVSAFLIGGVYEPTQMAGFVMNRFTGAVVAGR